jgi:hypothetical protein
VGAIFTRLLTAEAAASAGRHGGRWGARRGLGFRDFLGTGTPGARDGSGEATTSARAGSPARESRGAGNDNLLRSDADGGWELRRGRGVSGGVCGWVGVCVCVCVGGGGGGGGGGGRRGAGGGGGHARAKVTSFFFLWSL